MISQDKKWQNFTKIIKFSKESVDILEEISNEDQKIWLEFWQKSKKFRTNKKRNKSFNFPITVDLNKNVYKYPNLLLDCSFEENDNKIYSQEYPNGISLEEFFNKRKIYLIHLSEKIFESEKFSDQILLTYILKRAQNGDRRIINEFLTPIIYTNKLNKKIERWRLKIWAKSNPDDFQGIAYIKIAARLIGNPKEAIKSLIETKKINYSLHSNKEINEIKTLFEKDEINLVKRCINNVKKYKKTQQIFERSEKIILKTFDKWGNEEYQVNFLTNFFQIESKPFREFLNKKQNIREIKNHIEKHYNTFNSPRFCPNTDYSLLDLIYGKKGFKSKIYEDLYDYWMGQKGKIKKDELTDSLDKELSSNKSQDNTDRFTLRDVLKDPNTKTEEIYIKEKIKEIKSLVQKNFNPQEQRIFQGNIIEEKTIREVAKQEKISKSSAQRILTKIKKLIRKKYNQ